MTDAIASHQFDVAVIGAGPAGSSAALALARAGYDVVLLEKARLPRYKTCGGGVLGRAFKLLPPGAENVVETRFTSVALNFLGTRMSFTATAPQPLVYLTMRADLDAWLAREAAKAGAQVREACTIKRVVAQAHGVEIISDQATCRARFVIGADGIHGVTAKTAGWPALPRLAPALEHEIHLPPEDFARFSRMPRFDFNVIEAGYGWIFPKRTHLSAGILSTHRVCPDLSARLAEYLQRAGITRIQKMESHGYLIPLAPRPGPLARDRVLLAGDAAGLVDPVTAEGISHAILSGQLAATALIESRLDAAKTAAAYQALLEDHILGELRAARLLARVVYHHPFIRNLAFRWNGRKFCDFAAKVILGNASYREALKQPGSYLELLR